jgi:murein DD-endopeptidase MepM/ murein hydrolase activator NlpD
MPTEGFNWGILHNQNAVDIANSCGTPVDAAAEGLVVDESGNDVWSSGYGRYVIIEHPNNTKTRYAHLEKVAVSIGDYVTQGSQIGTMGNTGNVHGPTGCHLHFEIYGAANPFAK